VLANFLTALRAKMAIRKHLAELKNSVIIVGQCENTKHVLCRTSTMWLKNEQAGKIVQQWKQCVSNF
jgi:hypothetical protein